MVYETSPSLREAKIEKTGPDSQNEGSGAKMRNSVPLKLTVKHQKWRATMKVVSWATVSL